jgi:urease subunit beta
MALVPGEVLTREGDVELNEGRRTLTLSIANTGDRPIQVGSHYHFFEVNDALHFDRQSDRQSARGMRLNITAGTAVRFEPGQARTVQLVALAGEQMVYGFQGKVMGRL